MSSAYQSLYRKYRPAAFGETIGQRHVTQTLANAVANNRVAQAYLFCGPRGTGKTTTARALATALNCEKGPTAHPCGVCDACVEIRRGACLDVIEFDAASHRGVDDMEELRHRFQFAPGQTRYKVYIIDEVHQLSDQAFDMLLKVLEEPPQQVVFVLATTEAHKVKPTILSRCQRFDFHRVSVSEIRDRLQYVCDQEGFKSEPAALTALAQAADGSVRDALSLLDQAAAFSDKTITVGEVRAILGGIDPELLLEFAEVLVTRRVEAAFSLVDRVVAEGKDLSQLLKELLRHLRDLLVIKMSERARDEDLREIDMVTPPEYLPRVREQARQFSQKHLLAVIDLLCQTEAELRLSGQQRLLVELCVVRACSAGTVQQETAEEPATITVPAAPAPAAARPAPKPAPAPIPAAPKARPESTAAVTPAPPAAEEPAMRKAEAPEGLEQFKEKWDDVLALLRKEKQGMLRSVIGQADITDLKGQLVTLSFPAETEFSFSTFNTPDKRGIIEQAIAKVMGAKYKIECKLRAKSAGASPAAKDDDPLLSQAMDMFPGSELL
jgi:DNA polymerase III subunit gamma/tau